MMHAVRGKMSSRIVISDPPRVKAMRKSPTRI